MDALLNQTLTQQTWRRARLALTALVALPAGLALASWLLTRQAPVGYLFGLGLSVTFLLMLFLYSAGRLTPRWFWIALLALAVVDLGVMDATLFAARAKETVLAEGAEAAEFLAQQQGRFRVYSPSYSIPQQTPVEYRLELADGVDPLQLNNYSNFMEEAIDVESDGYSVTLPSFINGGTANDNQLAVPDVAKLALLNVGFVASEFELNVDGLELVNRFGTTYVYRLVESLPRAFIEGAPEKQVSITTWTLNRIELIAEGPGRLVLSELMYPGWVATADASPVDIETFQGIFRSVNIAEGTHHIIFEFRPISVFAGLGICLIAIIFLILNYRLETTERTAVRPKANSHRLRLVVD